MQSCDQTCAWCARNFWAWWKAREAQMSVPRRKKGETVSFNEEVTTSREKLPVAVGARVMWTHFGGRVKSVAAYRGVDGTWRCQVVFDTASGYPTTSEWEWCVDAEELVLVSD